MKTTILLLGLISLSKGSFAQYNLVPNGSFEIFDTCPNYAGQIRYAVPWTNPIYGTTPDYFNACDTTTQHFANVPNNFICFQYAHTGVAIASIITAWFPGNHAAWNYREYVQVELTDSLIAGKDYCLRFYASPCDSCHYISNNIGIYFSPVEIHDTTFANPLQYTPQFENPLTNNLDNRFGWNEISGTYTAVGGEKFIIIGNFHDTSSTIVTYTGWSNPNSNVFDCGYYFLDDILLTPCDSLTGIEENQFKYAVTIYPNPFEDNLNIESKYQNIQAIYITNDLGKIVFEETNILKRKVEIILTNLSNGIYFLKVITSKSSLIFKLIKN